MLIRIRLSIFMPVESTLNCSVEIYPSLFLQNCSVEDRHRFDADPDPDPTFYFDGDPDPDPNSNPNPNSSYTQVGKSDFFYVSLHCFIFLFSVIGVINFSILDSILKLTAKKV